MKTERQRKILEIIRDNICVTQEELQRALVGMGFNVTQSTVSRDIHELKLVKGRDKDGNYRYIYHRPENQERDRDYYKETFAGAVKSVSYALNNVVIKCHNGMASGTCVAVDAMFGDMMLGSLAGDDTIIIVTGSEDESRRLVASLEDLM